MELILPLYNNLLYVKGDKDITVTLDHTANHINPPKWRQYVTFQSEYKERIGLLRREQRAVPKEVGGDKIMPPILQIYEGKFNSAQPVKNFKKGLSCAFCEAQVNKYEELNQSFINATKLAAPAAAAKIIPLLLMDIAYLKSFEVEWERTAAALETEGAHGDDDDDEIDTSSWDPADPATVPFKNLKYPSTGKLPTAVLYAAAILGVSPNPTPEVKNWVVQVISRFEQLQETATSNEMTEILTRPMTDEEAEIYARCLNRYKDGEGAAADADADAAADADADIADADAATATATTETTAGPATANTRGGGVGGGAAVAGRAAAAAAAAAPATARSGDGAGGAAAAAAAAAAGGSGGSGGGGGADPDANEDDDAPIRPARKKQRAQIRDPPPPARRTPVQTQRYRPEDKRDSPATPRVIVKKRKARSPIEETDTPVVEAHAIPVSEHSHRVMLGQLDINKRFPKNYMAKRPIKKSPIAKATLSSIWHAVRNPHNET